MADINHIISLGVGSPAALMQFLTVGLTIAAELTTPSCRTWAIAEDGRVFVIDKDDRIFVVEC